MQYYSEKLRKLYPTVEELKAAEKEFDAKQKEVEKAKEERKAAAKAVEDAYKLADAQREAADEMLKEFVKKYGSYHTTVTKPTTIPSIFDILNNFPFWF